MDSLCNHKEFASPWADGEEPACTCDLLQQHVASQPATSSSHFFVDGDTLTFSSAPLTSIVNGFCKTRSSHPRRRFSNPSKRPSTPGIGKTLSRRFHYDTSQIFGKAHGLSTSTPPQTHHPQRHYAFQTTLPGLGVPQRGQACYVLADLLPMFIFRMPRDHLGGHQRL